MAINPRGDTLDDAAATAAGVSGSELYLRAWQHYRSGIAHFEQGEYAEAVREFGETIRCKPDSAQSFHWRAKALIELGDLEAALDDMNRAVLLRPRNPSARHARAVVLDRLGRLESACDDIKEAIRQSPYDSIYTDYFNRLLTRIKAARISAGDMRRLPAWGELEEVRLPYSAPVRPRLYDPRYNGHAI